MENQETSLFLNNIKIFDFDTSSSEKRYRVVNDKCDIEINENVKIVLDIIQSHQGNPTATIIHHINRITGMNVENLEKMIQALIQKGVLSDNSVEEKEIPTEDYHRNKMQNLWFRFRVVNTDKYERFFKSLSFVFSKPFTISVSVFFIVFSTVFLLIYFLSDWKNQLVYYSAWDYFLIFVIYSHIMILFHEIGHISAAKRYGSKTGGIGFGIYYFFLVAYADVHETWNLPRKQRMVVSIAGYYINMLFMLPVFILCFYFNSKAMADFILIFLISILSVFNPFLKMDGYWFLCDVLGVPNLKIRLNAYLYKFLPSKLFKKGKEIDPFKNFPLRTKRFIIGYTALFYAFMIFFLSVFLTITSRIVVDLQNELYLPIYHLINEWNQDTGNLSVYFNQVFRNAMILFGAGMLLFNYSKKIIRFIILKVISLLSKKNYA